MTKFKVGDIFVNNEPSSNTHKDVGEITKITSYEITYFWYKNNYKFVMHRDIFEDAVNENKYQLFVCNEREKLQILLKYT